MGILFSSAPVSILKFVFVLFMYSSVDHLFCCTVLFSIWHPCGGAIHMVASVMCIQVRRIFIFASAFFCKMTKLATFSAVFVICWAVTFVM